MTKLTPQQKALLCRAFTCGSIIILLERGDDTVAKNLSNKGLGSFTDHKFMYSWRLRSGYTNNFTPNTDGRRVRAKLLADNA